MCMSGVCYRRPDTVRTSIGGVCVCMVYIWNVGYARVCPRQGQWPVCLLCDFFSDSESASATLSFEILAVCLDFSTWAFFLSLV